MEAVADELGLHPLIAEDILERNQRPKLELTDGLAHLVVFAVAWERELLVDEIDLVLGGLVPADRPHGVLGSARAPSTCATAWRRSSPAAPTTSLWALLDHVVDELLPGLRPDRGRDRRPRGPDREPAGQRHPASSSSRLKRQLVELRHVSSPQREVFNQLTNRTLPFIAPEHVVYFRDIYDHAVHLSDEYDGFRELVSAALDVYLSTINNNLSLIMKRLTGITVILAGIGAFAGIFGMSEAGAAFSSGEAPGLLDRHLRDHRAGARAGGGAAPDRLDLRGAYGAGRPAPWSGWPVDWQTSGFGVGFAAVGRPARR